MIKFVDIFRWMRVCCRTSLAAIVPLIAIAGLLSLTPVLVHAESQYWVVVGSYPTLKRAEQARQEASAELSEAFDVRGGDTPTDYVYRVVVGPYETTMAARDMLTEARAGPYEQAWILPQAIDQELQVAAAQSSAQDAGYSNREDTDDPAAAFQSRPGRFDGRYDSGIDRKSGVSESSSEPSSQGAHPAREASTEEQRSDETIEMSKVPNLVQKAPSSYSLHKLRRDNAP
ncbi:MAG: SPOR domain-containing protein [Pseudomonadales bacterium]